jgi:hypothetical protein
MGIAILEMSYCWKMVGWGIISPILIFDPKLTQFDPKFTQRLIDYGQVKCMSIEERINYAYLIKAHAANNKEEVIRLHFDVLGTKTKYRKEEVG